MNLLRRQVRRATAARRWQSSDGWSYALSPENARKAQRSGTAEVVLGARHSTIRLHTEQRPESIPGRVYTVEPTGDVTYAHVHLGSAVLVVSVPPSLRLVPDEPVWIEFDQPTLHLFDGETEQALTG